MRQQPLPTHRVDVALPMNTKYLTGNPISRRLIAGFMRALVDLIGRLPLSTILEVGCGEGLILRQLDHAAPGMSMQGLDIDPALLRAARVILPRAGYVEGSIYSLPVRARSYDAVICTEVLEHLADPNAALQEIKRVTRSYCLFSVPHEPWWRLANMARGSYWRNFGNTPGHVNHWTSADFSNFIQRYLDIVDVRHPFPWTMVLATVRNGQ